jgi:hypothetical protein
MLFSSFLMYVGQASLIKTITYHHIFKIVKVSKHYNKEISPIDITGISHIKRFV